MDGLAAMAGASAHIAKNKAALTDDFSMIRPRSRVISKMEE
jgi:hypothetical protein